MKAYFALVHKERDSAYGINFPDLPGCFSAADSEQDIFLNAQEALALYTQGEGELPAARSVADLHADASIKSEIVEGAFLISVPLITVGQKGRYNLVLAIDLVAAIDRTARSVGVNRSEFVADALIERLKQSAGFAVQVGATRSVGLHSFESTSKGVASSASKVLRDPKARKAAKSAAASALTQKGSTEKTSAKVATTASKVLRDPKSSKEAKSVAASALTQKMKKNA